MSDDPAPFPVGDDLEVTLPAEMMLKVEDPKPLFVKIMNRISQSPTLGNYAHSFILLFPEKLITSFIFYGRLQLKKSHGIIHKKIFKLGIEPQHNDANS